MQWVYTVMVVCSTIQCVCYCLFRGPSLPKAEDNSSREPLNVDQDVSSQVHGYIHCSIAQ